MILLQMSLQIFFAFESSPMNYDVFSRVMLILDAIYGESAEPIDMSGGLEEEIKLVNLFSMRQARDDVARYSHESSNVGDDSCMQKRGGIDCDLLFSFDLFENE